MRNTNKGVDTMNCPCKGCTDREVGGCHDNCKKYKKWRAELDKRKSVIREKQAEINLTRSYVRDRMKEQKRRHR